MDHNKKTRIDEEDRESMRQTRPDAPHSADKQPPVPDDDWLIKPVGEVQEHVKEVVKKSPKRVRGKESREVTQLREVWKYIRKTRRSFQQLLQLMPRTGDVPEPGSVYRHFSNQLGLKRAPISAEHFCKLPGVRVKPAGGVNDRIHTEGPNAYFKTSDGKVLFLQVDSTRTDFPVTVIEGLLLEE